VKVALLLAGALLAGCVSQTTVETKNVQDAAAYDARRRAEIHASLASEYYQRGNMTIALDETRLAIKDDPNFIPAYNMRGLIYMELREDALAREAFEEAMRRGPNDPEVMNNYGWFLCLRGDPARGMDYFARVLAVPLYATPEKPLLNAGVCSRLQGKNDDAESYLRRALAIRPELPGALYNLAEILYEKGNSAEAEVYIIRYTRVADPTASALALGVRIARAQGDRVTADSMLQQLKRRYPDAQQTRELTQGATRP
jgi:type IV pilus assembly protein PilF